MTRAIDCARTTVLALGAQGKLDGHTFTLAGRRVIRGYRGSVWNEWTLDGLPHTTLAEGAGRFTLYREAPLVTSLDALTAGERLPWLVVERGTARCVAQFGEVPPGPSSWDYADLSEIVTGRRATISSGTSFTGDAIWPTGGLLGLQPHDGPPALVPTPNVATPSGLKLWLEIGDTATPRATQDERLAYDPWRVVGVVARASESGQWEEYCLYSAHRGLRWLVLSDGHWSWVENVEAGIAVQEQRGPGSSQTYRDAASGEPELVRVTWATGELPWEVEIGETVTATEHGELVEERTPKDVTWSRQRPLATDDIARAFDKRALPKPR